MTTCSEIYRNQLCDSKKKEFNNKCFINLIPECLLVEIFFNFNLFFLEKTCSLVCKKWYNLANDPVLLKKIVHRDWAFGYSKWMQYCGNSFVKGESFSEEYDSLPFLIGKILKSPCPIYSHLRILDSHFLIRIPKTMYEEPTSVMHLKRMLVECFSGDQYGLRSIQYLTETQEGFCIENSYWALVTKEILPGSNNKKFDDQMRMIFDLSKATQKTYENLFLVEMLFFVAVLGFKTLENGDNNGLLLRHARCHSEKNKNHPIVALHISKEAGCGLRLDGKAAPFNKVGVVALRKLMPSVKTPRDPRLL